MSWNQLSYTTKREVRESLSDLVTVVSRTRFGNEQILGTAFPISVTESHTMMLTASHVVEEGFRQSGSHLNGKVSRQLSHLPYLDNTPYKVTADWVENSKDLWCLLAVGDDLVQCFATGVCLRPPLDMALLIVDTSHLDSYTKPFQINSKFLNVGDKIVVTSLVTDGNVRNLIGRLGVITEVQSNGALVNAPMYRTNIPIEAGASGGPVFRYTGDFNSTKQVIGVVSSDVSEQNSFEDPNIDGDSYVSIICSAAPLQVSNSDGEKHTFQDMCKNGVILDVGGYIEHVELSYKPDGNWEQKLPVVNI